MLVCHISPGNKKCMHEIVSFMLVVWYKLVMQYNHIELLHCICKYYLFMPCVLSLSLLLFVFYDKNNFIKKKGGSLKR